MITKKMLDALNSHFLVEISASYQYLAMETYCRSISMNGAGAWFHAQSKEEYEHAMKFYNYIDEQQGTVEFQSIDKPQTSFNSLLDVFEHALSQEQKVSSQIHSLVALAKSENDYATENFLQWFVNEQVEEENSVSAVVSSIKLIGNDGTGLYILDRKLAARDSE